MNQWNRDVMRPDLRHRRAMTLAHQVMQIVDCHLERHVCVDRRFLRDIHEELLATFMQAGVEVLTDYARAEMGLPQRLGDGWTMEEIIALEERRLAALCAPMTMLVDKTKFRNILEEKPDDDTKR